MSKRFCKDGKELDRKSKGRKDKYICAKCDHPSPKEKWICKPREIKR